MAVCETFNTVADFFHCGAGSMFGGDGTVFAILCLLVFALFAYKARLNSTLSLGFAWALTFGFFLLFYSNSPWIWMLFTLLTIGLAIRLASAVMYYGRI